MRSCVNEAAAHAVARARGRDAADEDGDDREGNEDPVAPLAKGVKGAAEGTNHSIHANASKALSWPQNGKGE
jgi:hypothetical protein